MTGRQAHIALSSLLTLLLSTAGCVGTKRSIGEQPDADGSGAESGGTGDEGGTGDGSGGSDGGGDDGDDDNGHSGPVTPEDLWKGYTEAFEFPSGTSRIWLQTGRLDGAPLAAASVVFGDADPPPPPGDPDELYPPSLSSQDSMFGLQGFVFTPLDVEVDGKRSTFKIDYFEPWVEWCESQRPRPIDVGDYGCYDEPRDLRDTICQDTCACDSERCWAEDGHVLSFDINFHSDFAADGSINDDSLVLDGVVQVNFEHVDPDG
jgi:hypothetical protein